MFVRFFYVKSAVVLIYVKRVASGSLSLAKLTQRSPQEENHLSNPPLLILLEVIDANCVKETSMLIAYVPTNGKNQRKQSEEKYLSCHIVKNIIYAKNM